MLTRTKSEAHLDEALEAAGDDLHAARAEPEDEDHDDRRESSWIRWMRLNADQARSKKRASGKNSPIDGPWNSPSVGASLAIRVAA